MVIVMGEKRFRQFGVWVIDDPNLEINTVADVFATKIMSTGEVVDLLNRQQISIETMLENMEKLEKENKELKKQLSKYDKPKISIFNKDKGDWKWNDNNDIILNIRTGKSFYLRNSGAVENLVGMLNEQQATITHLEKVNGKNFALKRLCEEYIIKIEHLEKM